MVKKLYFFFYLLNCQEFQGILGSNKCPTGGKFYQLPPEKENTARQVQLSTAHSSYKLYNVNTYTRLGLSTVIILVKLCSFTL